MKLREYMMDCAMEEIPPAGIARKRNPHLIATELNCTL
jgi:hypothetical protein